ncbi:hypothetical protein HYH02_005185 [Chlamydomonas schloesseri]|uniref:Uncharacterized protein n=1 Tax=Chlamydomonas schloesseri TaxID=2026947 RepID=A0A835WL13_9CHLO|nr:hypothetical protein HYH02_005185 [Chlamydomonas schloesseri]|eukprot:KAG2449653.1 hypothetical protein HYH02_005185 [Chlamydomonas schloesseri]
MAPAIYRILNWKPSEARQHAEAFVGRSCMAVLAGALALVLSQGLALAGVLDSHTAHFAGNASTAVMLAGFAGLALGACLMPAPATSQRTHDSDSDALCKESASGELPDNVKQQRAGQKPV